MRFCLTLYIDIGESIPYLQADPNWLKADNIESIIFVGTIIK